MSPLPVGPERPIYHITHVDNLPGILQEGGLWCDAQRIARGLTTANIGHRHIKGRRLRCPVRAAAGGMLGDYVPFNFCPRSVMLYAVHRGHADYSGGQECIVHLESSIERAIATGRPWAFTDRHAELAHALHLDDLRRLDEVPWHVMGQHYWTEVREERQAEFLVHQFFPWSAVLEVAAMTTATAVKVQALLSGARHMPRVTKRPEWYY